ncbi:hypothetical protein C8K30_106194 [Promicromonospora sp. AC04]|uniref:DUF3592 domain-containing protein n=1 Tax=Promicromonospora sp. AC04 TaxID=2135723 RepID=UPI000D381D2E|nr:DUF3592 domain-containing protein [Promicromonospora sp. AC04]PUB26106.1 hypothetical protein C8K30_106194 [Promicromonospora sp. AC04]
MVRIDLSAVRRTSTDNLLFTICAALIFSAFPGYVTFEYIQDRLILADRGVRVNAWVVDYNWVRRGPDTVVVRPDDPPYFEATLSRGPDGIKFNDRLDVVFDPRAPGRIVAVDEPLIDGYVLLFAGLDLLALLALLGGLVAVRELLRRVWARRHGGLAQTRGDPPVGPRPRLLAAWETPQIVLLLVIAPVLSAAILGPLAASSVNDAAALRTSGVVVQAVVVKSTWDGAGELDVRFPTMDGTKHSAYVTVGDGVYYEGDSVEVIYEPAAPGNAQLAGEDGWESEPWIFAGTFIAFSATAAATVPVAVVALIRRARGGR